jgi:hypothetical protein
MFHILIENSTPNRLVGGPWSSIREFSSNDAPSTLECGLKGGQVREAITQKDFKDLVNTGKLNDDRCCKLCLRRVGGKYSGKRKNTQATSTEGDSNEEA